MPSHADLKGLFRRGRDPWRFFAAIVVLTILAAPLAAQTEDEQEGADPAWSGSVSLRALSRLSQYGLDSAPERVTTVVGGTIAHVSGFSLGVSTALQPDPWKVQRTSLTAEVELALTDRWTLGLSLVRSWYPAGSTNPFAASPTSATVDLSYDGDLWSFGADLDQYFGGEGATYASVDASVFLAGDGFSVLPIVSLSFGSQTVTSGTLKRGTGRATTVATTATTVTGLSSIDGMVVFIVPLGDGWSVSAMPGVMYTPSDLASTTTRFTWSVGVRKAL
jgi:hypothetical protein